MRRRIIIDFIPGPNAPSIHQIRNFGEDLWHACKEDGWATTSLDEADRATNRLEVTVLSKQRLHRIRQMIARLLASHFLDSHARMTIVHSSED